ncbi:response regulator [Lederbergia ruris]|uniref:Sporulation initiation phosphotransferase F n=1 Tax=Lederbergia ruris TaxID=217495 RepID=A0ABQ4KGU7_9BACI|nr:response regulator [Lederbergia ruris]GIN57177.1 sporulation initiation phosphotransferase F [Lederbergia ruris]
MTKKILIVDDQFGIRILLNEILQKEGYQIYQAANGPEALSITQEHNPDLVLLDMKIPGMSGPEILAEMKKMKADIGVMIMTAYGEHELIKNAQKLGVIAHFSKPFDIEEVRSAVKEYLFGGNTDNHS